MTSIIKNKKIGETSNINELLIPNFKLFNKNIARNTVQKGNLKQISKKQINYKNLDLLKKFVSKERGKIIPGRISKISTKKQRLIKKAVKHARQIALLP